MKAAAARLPRSAQAHAAGDALLAVCAVAAPADAREDTAWTARQAEMAVQVCPSRAPSLSEFERIVRDPGDGAAGPEVFVSLQAELGACICAMSAGAPTRTALAEAMFKQLLKDFPDSWRPAAAVLGHVAGEAVSGKGAASVRPVPAGAAASGRITAQARHPEGCPA